MENKDTAFVCMECGAPLGGTATSAERASGSSESEVVDYSATEQQGNGKMYNYQQPIYAQQQSTVSPGAMGKAVASLILGLAGLIISCVAPFISGIPAILGLLLSIIGIVFAVKARNGIPIDSSGRGVATAGLVFSILGTVIGGLISLVVVCLLVGVVTCVCSTPTANIDYYTILFPLFF